ncbi:hypothetical protein BSL78_10269 [Apostichopus japonicus]|uniref:Uncharacterized protein n=1 Tax=Stichopus japonicus TaxID=307972 RepID=A0A2G8KXU1_STIJA|nr:hypothetical protein BSL78_10269 [Apostichopus japonicus]
MEKRSDIELSSRDPFGLVAVAATTCLHSALCTGFFIQATNARSRRAIALLYNSGRAVALPRRFEPVPCPRGATAIPRNDPVDSGRDIHLENPFGRFFDHCTVIARHRRLRIERERECESDSRMANGPSPVPSTVTWLILPVVICLSRRLSNARLSTILNIQEKLQMAH